MYLLAQFLQGSILTSCNKDETNLAKQTPTQLNDKELGSSIVVFRETLLDNKKAATNETMNFGESVWMMEATFNYYHAFASEDYISTQTDSIYLPVDYTNLDNVSLSELQELFITANNEMLALFNETGSENKRTVLFDLELEATPDGNQLLIMMTVGNTNTQKAGSQSGSSITPFGSTDYWYPGTIHNNQWNCLGKCDIYVGESVGISDATFELEKAARKYIRGTISYHYYFADVKTRAWLADYDGLFKGFSTECISPYTMNLHYNILADKIEYWYSYFNVSLAKQLVDLNIVNDGRVISTNNTIIFYSKTFFHSLQFGVKKVRTVPV